MRILILFLLTALLLSGCSLLPAQLPFHGGPGDTTVGTPAAQEETTTAAETTPAPQTLPAYEAMTGPFAAEDLICDTLAPGCTPEDAEAALGAAGSREQQTDPGSGEALTVLTYGSNRLIFSQNRLTEVDLHDVSLAGPRGIRMGDPVSLLEETYGLFGDGDPYYEMDGGLPPRAEKIALEGDPFYTIMLTAPMADYDEAILTEGLAYMGQEHAQLVYTIDSESERITGIHWIIAPLSEDGG